VVTPETEEAWIGAARGKTCAEVQQLVSGKKRGDGPDDPDDPDLRPRWLRVEMTPQMLAEYRALRVAIESEMGHRLDEREVWQAILARAKAGGKAASTPAQISLCTHCDRGWQDGAGFRAELDPAELACALCDGEHLGSVDCDALVELGWKRAIARAATDEAIAHVGTDVPIEALIREALRRCPKPHG